MQPSTVAYAARLLIHRYAMLGLLDAEGFPVSGPGMLAAGPEAAAMEPALGRRCPECGHLGLVRQDGCDFCTVCGHLGACG